MTLTLIPGRLSICRLDPDLPLPAWAIRAPVWSITRTEDELSVVAPEESVPDGVRRDEGWRALQVEGPLDLSLTGVLASVAEPLAEARIPLFAISTYDTDLVLIRNQDARAAVEALRRRGHRVSDPGG